MKILIYNFFFSFQTVDEDFNEEEKRFRSIEKLVKIILKNINQFVDEFKVAAPSNAHIQRVLAGFNLEIVGAKLRQQFSQMNEIFFQLNWIQIAM